MAVFERQGIVAVDMGGTYLKSGVVVPDEVDHATLARTFRRIPMSDTPQRTSADVLAGALDVALDVAGPFGIEVTDIAISTPGPFDWERGVSRMAHKFLSIRGVDLRVELRTRVPQLSSIPIRFVPDALAFAAGERCWGAGRGYERCICITLGTGIGSAATEGDRIVLRFLGKSPDGAIWDAPYREGTTEDYVSARALLAAYRRTCAADVEPGVDVKQVADRARAGEGAALETFRRFGEDLGGAILSFARDFAPRCIVLGGGIAASFALFEPAMRATLAPMPGLQRIVASELGEYGPLLGLATRQAREFGSPPAPAPGVP